MCSLQQAGFWCYANLPSVHRLHRGRACPLHLIPCPPLLLCSSPLNFQTIFSSPLFNLFFLSPCFSTPHVITPQPPPPSHSPLFFFCVFRSSSTCFYSCRSPLTWPFTALCRSFKKKMCVCLCMFLHVCLCSVSPCKGQKARPLKWLHPFDRGQRFCLVSLWGWKVGGGGHTGKFSLCFTVKNCVRVYYVCFFIMVNVQPHVRYRLFIRTKLNELSYLYYQ